MHIFVKLSHLPQVSPVHTGNSHNGFQCLAKGTQVNITITLTFRAVVSLPALQTDAVALLVAGVVP